MNDQELESLLRKVTPAPPSPDLMARLEQARPQPAGRIVAWPGWLYRVALPLAAAAALALWVAGPRQPAEPLPGAEQAVPPRFETVGAQSYVLGTEAVGIGHDEAGRPYRVLRSYGVRREVWKNTADGSEVATVEPQQQLLLAKMDVY